MSKEKQRKTAGFRPQGASGAPRGGATGEVSFAVADGDGGRTVTALLHDHAGLSHGRARGIVAAGLVAVDGRPVEDPAQRVPTGCRVTARHDSATRYRAPGRAPASTSRWFRIVHRDADLMVVDKAPGLATIPVAKGRGVSLMDRLLRKESPKDRERGLWVVHRIDRFASGLVVVARHRKALERLSEQFAARTATRRYLALCDGRPPRSRGELVSYLKEDPRTHKLFPTSEPAEGARAALRYRVVEPLGTASLVEVSLETGRRNQIRVQMAEIGCPLVGDRAYGTASRCISRVALHAAELGFRHPRTGQPLRFTSPLPADFVLALERLRQGEAPPPGRSTRTEPAARKK